MQTRYFWIDKHGRQYGPFRMDEEGNPHAGDVVQHYRQLKNISTKALGKELEKSARWVQLMEKENTVPELISRRKALIRVLGIPPILLFPNIYGGDDLVRILEPKTPPTQIYNSSAASSLDLRYCAEMLQLYWSSYHVSGAQNLLVAIEEKIPTLQGFVTSASGHEQSKALILLCRYRQLAALIAGERDDFDRAFLHLNPAIIIAEEMHDPEMQAVCFFRRGLTHSAQGNFVEAFVDLKKAQAFEGAIPTTLTGRILLSTGKAEARLSKTEKEKRETLNLFEKAGKIIRDGMKEEDTHFIKLTEGNYHEHRAAALSAMGNLTEAAEELQEASETFPADQARRHNNIDAMQAELAVKSGEHVIAASVALRTFDVAKQLDMARNINVVGRVYSQLRQGPYSKSKDVRELGDKLRGWNKTPHMLH